MEVTTLQSMIEKFAIASLHKAIAKATSLIDDFPCPQTSLREGRPNLLDNITIIDEKGEKHSLSSYMHTKEFLDKAMEQTLPHYQESITSSIFRAAVSATMASVSSDENNAESFVGK